MTLICGGISGLCFPDTGRACGLGLGPQSFQAYPVTLLAVVTVMLAQHSAGVSGEQKEPERVSESGGGHAGPCEAIASSPPLGWLQLPCPARLHGWDACDPSVKSASLASTTYRGGAVTSGRTGLAVGSNYSYSLSNLPV